MLSGNTTASDEEDNTSVESIEERDITPFESTIGLSIDPDGPFKDVGFIFKSNDESKQFIKPNDIRETAQYKIERDFPYLKDSPDFIIQPDILYKKERLYYNTDKYWEVQDLALYLTILLQNNLNFLSSSKDDKKNMDW